MKKNMNIQSSSSQTGKEEDGQHKETHNLLTSSDIQRNVQHEALAGEQNTSIARMGKILDHHSKLGSIPPVPSLTRLGKVVEYSLVSCILCNPTRHQQFKKLWCCAFEPNQNDPKKTSSVAAACGGESICLVYCTFGDVVKQKNFPGEDFRTLAWTTVKLHDEENLNILAAGGNGRTIWLFHSYYLINYDQLRGHLFEITCLTFHPCRPTILFSGDRQGNVLVWDINVPSQTASYHYLLMRLKCPCPDFYPVMSLVVMPNYAALLASCGDGIFAWTLHDFRPIFQEDKEPPASLQIKIPTKRGPWFDGLARLSEDLIVVNSIEEGESYVFDFSQVISSLNNSAIESMTVEALGKLRWLETEDVYVNINARPGLGAVVSGNNKGSIWIYDLQQYVVNSGSYSKFDVMPIKEIELNPVEFPRINEPTTKAKVGVVTSIDINSDGRYLVFVTDDGYICMRRFKNG